MTSKTLLTKNLKDLYKLFWKYFSIYIRYSQENCFTCGKFTDPKRSHAGHYIHEGNSNNWWLMSSEKNINKQCERCNYHMNGNLTQYALRLEGRYGHGILQELEDLKWNTSEPTKEEVVEKIVYYRELSKKLQ